MSADRFSTLTDRVARLDLGARESELGLQLDRSAWQRHRLGFRDAPLYELSQPQSPDDAWDVQPIADGRRAARGPASEAVQACGHWLTAAPDLGARLLAALPAGSYFVVRSPRVPQHGKEILLGNEWVPSRPNILTLRDQRPLFAFLVGAESPPRGPLIGTVILNNTGNRRSHEVLWFAFDDGPSEAEIALILPLDGELILDNYAGFGAEEERLARARWRDHGAEACARWCAGEELAAFP